MCLEGVRVHGTRAVVALGVIAADGMQELVLLLRLHSLGDDGNAEAVAMLTMEVNTLATRGLRSRLRMKTMSALRMSTGMSLKALKDEYPLPKSSMRTVKP